MESKIEISEKFYTADQIAEMWGRNIDTIRRLLRSGKLKGFRSGPGKRSPYLVSETELNRYIGKNGTNGENR